jgi:hypothetical protein
MQACIRFSGWLVLQLISVSTLAQLPPAGEGLVLVAMGRCRDTRISNATLLVRRVDGSDRKTLTTSVGYTALVGKQAPEYEDETGKYSVHTVAMASGDWEIYQHQWRGYRVTVTSMPEYRHAFTVRAGAVTDLGRFCAASQNAGERDPGDENISRVTAYREYLLVTRNRASDVEAARRQGGGAVPLEVIDAAPHSPESVHPHWRSAFIEPRLIVRPIDNDPCTTGKTTLCAIKKQKERENARR